MATRPNSLKRRTFEGARSPRRASSSAAMTLSRLRRSSMSMKSITMMPPRSRRRIWRTISFAASALVRTIVSSRRFERLGVVDDDIAAGFEPYLRPQPLVNFLLDAEFLEDRIFLGVELHADHES